MRVGNLTWLTGVLSGSSGVGSSICCFHMGIFAPS
jgi:hypothetical protein